MQWLTQLSANQVIDPQPGERPERYLQRARPVDSPQKRILLPPAGELPLDFVPVCPVASEQLGLGKHHQVLVPVQFPDVFVIPNLAEIQIRNKTKVARAAGPGVDVIPPPFDSRTRVERCSQYWQPVLHDAVRQDQEFFLECGTGQIPANVVRTRQSQWRWLAISQTLIGKSPQCQIGHCLARAEHQFSRATAC